MGDEKEKGMREIKGSNSTLALHRANSLFFSFSFAQPLISQKAKKTLQNVWTRACV